MPVAMLKRDRMSLIARTSADRFDWALQQALNASKDDAFLRALPLDFDRELLRTASQKIQPGERWQVVQDTREVGSPTTSVG